MALLVNRMKYNNITGSVRDIAKHKSVGKKRIEFKTWSNSYKLIDATKCIDAAKIYDLNLFDFLFHIP